MPVELTVAGLLTLLVVVLSILWQTWRSMSKPPCPPAAEEEGKVKFLLTKLIESRWSGLAFKLLYRRRHRRGLMIADDPLEAGRAAAARARVTPELISLAKRSWERNYLECRRQGSWLPGEPVVDEEDLGRPGPGAPYTTRGATGQKKVKVALITDQAYDTELLPADRPAVQGWVQRQATAGGMHLEEGEEPTTHLLMAPSHRCRTEIGAPGMDMAGGAPFE